MIQLTQFYMCETVKEGKLIYNMTYSRLRRIERLHVIKLFQVIVDTTKHLAAEHKRM